MGMQRASGFSTGHVRPASVLSLCLLQGFLARDFYLFLPEDSETGLPEAEYQLDPMSMACNCQWLDLPQYARRRIIGIVSRLLPGSLSEPEIYLVSGEALQPKALLFQQTASQKLQKPDERISRPNRLSDLSRRSAL